jgi:ketosteroid isomerase-like protein
VTMTHTPATAGVTPRQAFDELLRRKVAALAQHGLSPDAPEEINRAAREDAQLMEAQCRAFADAVDRDGRNLPYGDAIVLAGTAGEIVVPLRDYVDTPVYWHAVAGEVDLIIDGADVMQALNTP